MSRAARVGALTALFAACSSQPVTTLHDLHQSSVAKPPTLLSDFFALPFPNNLRMEGDGTIDLSMFPRYDGIPANYVDAVDRDMRGFGTNSGIYFRFDGPIDAATLPADPNASIDAGATAFVVDVTPGSPTYGQRHPVISHFVPYLGATPSTTMPTAGELEPPTLAPNHYEFIGPNWLCLLPFQGVPLREKTTYAAVITDGVHAADGTRLLRAKDFDDVMGQRRADARVAGAIDAYAPFRSWVDTQPGLAARVVNATVFTTLDATSIMDRLRAAVLAQAPAPTLDNLKYSEAKDQPNKGDTTIFFEGTYAGPNFQAGDPPYSSSGGGLVFDDQGVPQMQRIEPALRVAMTVPTGQMPTAGWPVILYAHGTGGDYMSFINDGSGTTALDVQDSAGSTITKFAMISIDQVLHGPRAPAGTDVDLAFYNVNNIVAARTNGKQGALDDFQLMRLVKAIDVAAAPTTGQPIKFDPAHIYFKGHSQGGLTGPLFVVAEPDVQAAIFSGAGGGLVQALLGKTKPVNIPALVGAILADPVDQFHPLLNLVQLYFEDTDPINYARYYFKEPRNGMRAKPIFQSLGVVDHYTPIATIKALGMAMGVQPINPAIEPIANLDVAGLAWDDPPKQLNVDNGNATGVLLEYYAARGSDGHFVIFDIPAAIHQSNRFLATHVTTGIARLDPP